MRRSGPPRKSVDRRSGPAPAAATVLGWRRPLAALSVAATTGSAAVAQAGVGADVALTLGYHFGNPTQAGRLGVGVEGRILVFQDRNFDERPDGLAGGAGARLAFVGWDQTRLLITPQLGWMRNELGLGFELGLGLGFGAPGGARTTLAEPALRADYQYVMGRLSFATGSAPMPWSLGVGPRFPKVADLALERSTSTPGRPLRGADGQPAALPALAIGEGGQPAADAAGDRARTGRIWARRARHEWCSIPAFGELASQLRSSGAPDELAARALAAADDELRHTVTAGFTSAILGGGPLAIAPAGQPRRPALSGHDGLLRLVRESWLDGCLNEGAAAACVRAESQEPADRSFRAELAAIAADEERHAELAWDVLRFALGTGDSAVRTWLQSAAERSEHLAAREAPEQTDDPDLLATSSRSLASTGVLPAERAATIRTQHHHACHDRLRALLQA